MTSKAKKAIFIHAFIRLKIVSARVYTLSDTTCLAHFNQTRPFHFGGFERDALISQKPEHIPNQQPNSGSHG